MIFFTGIDDLYYAYRFPRCFINVNRLRDRVSDFEVNDWIMDSGAFMELLKFGRYRFPVEEYAALINRWMPCGNMLAAVTQDYMCESIILEQTGLTVDQHQTFTIERYQALIGMTSAYVMPVLQGFKPGEYLSHIQQYGPLLAEGAWCGVGSVCKRNSHPAVIEYILRGIKRARPDLRLHGFGLKLTALHRPEIRALLYSADSEAWSKHVRCQTHVRIKELQRERGRAMIPAGEARIILAERGEKLRSAHDWREADAYRARIDQPDAHPDEFSLES